MNDENYIIRVTRLTVVPETEPLHSDRATRIEICDEAAGEYLAVEQQSGSTSVREQRILIEPEEWPTLKAAIDQLMQEVRK
jgi:hypothetical protein